MTNRTFIPLALLVVLAFPSAALAAPPGNNDFPGFPLAGANVSFAGTNVDATGQPGEDDHAGMSEDVDCVQPDPTCITSVWWNWKAPSAGIVNVNLCASGYDTTLGVYKGLSVGSLTQEASNDDLDPTDEEEEEAAAPAPTAPLRCPSNRKASGAEFTAVAGTTYYIAVAGFWGETGPIAGRISSGALGTQPPNTGPCSNRLLGSNGKDNLIGTPFGDRIGGRGNNDRIAGGRGDDCLFGDRGNDRLDGGAGKDKVSGGPGRDKVRGGAGNDVVAGGSGNDRISGGSGKDRMSGGPGNDRIGARDRKRDRIDCGRGRDVLVADRGDRVRRCEIVVRRR